MNTLQTSFNFDVLNQYKSFVFLVGTVPWCFLIKKILTDDIKNGAELQIILICKYDNKEVPANFRWSIEAEAAVKLKPFNDGVKSILRIFPMTKFHGDYMISEPQKIALLDGQIDGVDSINFIIGGRFKFEAMVKANPLRIEHIATYSSASFGFVIKNVKDLTCEKTPTFSLQGLDWYLEFEKEDEHLSVFLYLCRRPEDFAWFVNTTCSIKLLPTNVKGKPLIETFRERFKSDVPNWGFPEFIAWKDLLDENKTYVNSDAFFEISVQVEPLQPIWEYIAPITPNCPICFEKFAEQKVVSTACGHLFCSRCIRKLIKTTNKCALCNENASANYLRIVYLP